MAKLFILLASGDPRILTDVVNIYVRNAKNKGWMEAIRIILWGPSEKVVVTQVDLKSVVMDLVSQGFEVWACKQCADDYSVTEKLEALGVKVVEVGAPVSQMINEGWQHLSF